MKKYTSDYFWMYLNGTGLALSLLLAFGVLALITFKGMAVFWPQAVYEINYQTPQGIQPFFGEKIRENDLKDQTLYRTGSREINGFDFKWFTHTNIDQVKKDKNIAVIHRLEWGNVYGIVDAVLSNGQILVSQTHPQWRSALAGYLDQVDALREKINTLKRRDIGAVNYQLEQLNLKEKKLAYQQVPKTDDVWQRTRRKRQALGQKYQTYERAKNSLSRKIKTYSIRVKLQNQTKTIALANVEKIDWPNQMSGVEKLGTYLNRFYHFIMDEPREANTEGGIFPAIFGTLVMVILMSIFVTPLGIMVAFYLNEYAKDNYFTRLIRISINNMAGIPAIVYGIFGLGFFVYTLGGSVDALFYPERLPSPTWGTPGLLWASLTLALLTLPVVVVATEEGLARIPNTIRESVFALGATKFEMLKVIMPLVVPSMITGLILAIARAAGEVSPLMLVGAVKLAPAAVIDGNFPFFHFDRKFMHIGFHVYDLGFQSPNIEITAPLVFVSALLLVALVLSLNIFSIVLRSKYKNRYKL